MKYFGTDGIRGKALTELNAELAYKLGQAMVYVFKLDQIIIGHDTRQSSPLLAYSLATGAMSQGANVLFAGEVPTPAVAYASKTHALWSVMVTASHNPFTDNGIKIFNKGYKTNEQEEAALEVHLDQGALAPKKFGELSYFDIKESYYKLFAPFNKVSLKIAYDCANGATYQTAQAVWRDKAFHSLANYVTPDGLNINKDCGSTHSHIIFDIVKAHQMDLGFSYDGDGDRLIACDQKQIYDGDVLLYAFAKYLKKHGKLKGNKVVLTQMSNPGIVKAFNQIGVDVIRTKVGDKYVVEAIYQDHLSLGGENSGHLILNDILHSGDGVLASAYLAHILDLENTTLHDYVKEVQMYPFKLINLKDIDKTIIERPHIIAKIKEVSDQLTDSLVLVRASGTENLIRITASNQSQLVVDETIESIKKIILGER